MGVWEQNISIIIIFFIFSILPKLNIHEIGFINTFDITFQLQLLYNLIIFFSGENILSNLATIDLKIQKVILNQNRMMEILEKLQNSNVIKLDNNVSFIQKRDFEYHFKSSFPLDNIIKFRNGDDKLNHDCYYNLMVW